MSSAPKAPEVADRERQIDELVAQSRTWKAVRAALVAVLAKHPAAAREVVAALRGIEL